MNFDDVYRDELVRARKTRMPDHRARDIAFCTASHLTYVTEFGPFTKENPDNLVCVCGAHKDRPQL